jgi:hypothetical protein
MLKRLPLMQKAPNVVIEFSHADSASLPTYCERNKGEQPICPMFFWKFPDSGFGH